jgi:hypothetical protein
MLTALKTAIQATATKFHCIDLVHQHALTAWKRYWHPPTATAYQKCMLRNWKADTVGHPCRAWTSQVCMPTNLG